jgi:hypothetical protein
MKSGLKALADGELEARNGLDPEDLRRTLGYPDYDTQARRFIAPD